MLEGELESLEVQITTREGELAELLPDWDALRARETDAKRALDGAQGRLAALYAKQGRLNRFKTRAERDRFLASEIASLGAFRTAQARALDGTRRELAGAQRSLAEVDERRGGVRVEAEEAREAARKAGEEAAQAKDEHAEMVERRKGLWREDTKLDSLVSRAGEELRSAERQLAGMMDKVRVPHVHAGACS